MHKKSTPRKSDDLRFNVAQLLKEGTGGSREYDIEATFAREIYQDLFIVAPIVGVVKLLRTGSDILVTGTLHSAVEKSCGRCLTTFTTPISIELEEEFYPTTDILSGGTLPEPEDADEANRIDEQHILDLTEVVRQELVVTGESILYCKPDCKGLCPQCGQDRNVVECDCQEQQIDPRWGDLLALKIDDN